VQAALISYALFLLLLLIVVFAVLIIVAVRSLLMFINKRGKNTGRKAEQGPACVVRTTPTEGDH
jgi:flagellar basal body-associated protein FliL